MSFQTRNAPQAVNNIHRAGEQSSYSSLTISAKPDGTGAASQPWIANGEQSGLLTGMTAQPPLQKVISPLFEIGAESA